MNTRRPISEPIRLTLDWEERWGDTEKGLVSCWERGREKSLEDPGLAAQAKAGRLVLLPWRGGVEKAIKAKQKYGSLYYLAMWQGLRGEDLNIDIEKGAVLTCSATQMMVLFTQDLTKFTDE